MRFENLLGNEVQKGQNSVRFCFTVWGMACMQLLSQKLAKKISPGHKRPYKARFIANSSSCTTTNWSKLLTSCLTAVKKHWVRYYELTIFGQLKILIMFSINLNLKTFRLLRVWEGLRFPVSILYKSIADRYRTVRVADGPITDRYRFIKNASWVCDWGTPWTFLLPFFF